jgi:drug/metabolite transporter (DMT)-like permease
VDLPTLGALAALGSAATWAVTSLLVRSLSPPFTAVAINALRSSLAGALLLGWVLASDGFAGLAGVSTRAFVLLGVSIALAIGIGDTVFFESTRSLGLGRAMTIAMTYPVGAALLAAAFLDEPVTPRVAAGTLLTLGGLALIVHERAETPGAARPWRGIGAATLASAAWAVSIVVMRTPLREIEPATAQAIRLPIAALLLWVTPWSYGALGALRLGGRAGAVRVLVLSALTAVSSVMFVASVKYAGVAVSAVLSSTAPLFAIPLGVLFLGERVSRRTVTGALVTILGIVVLER